MQILAVCALVLAPLVAGCSASDGDKPAAKAAPATTSADPYALTPAEEREVEEEVLLEAKDDYAGGPQLTDAQFVSVGRGVCRQLDSGKRFETVVAITAVEWDARSGHRLSLFEAAELVGESVGSLCEEHMSELD